MNGSSRRQLARGAACAGLAACLSGGLGGCLERTIRVTSEPPGAMVWLNDVEIGRTPAEARFKFYGTYDVRLEMAGFEPVHEGREAAAPFYEYPGPDLVAAAVPARFHNRIEWHYVLEPAQGLDSPEAEAAILERARGLRERLGAAPEAAPTEPDPTDERPAQEPRPESPPDIPPMEPN
ncbi:MAG: PEGA domain-containing protein [Phycisphaerales bacterium]|nr:PEGA domain-containing protein [Phycisphaerales bacterium]